MATGAVACLVVLTSVLVFGARRQSSAALRVALSDPYPETRRAAVLVAARHGLANHAGLLVAHSRRETAEDVLFALAMVVRDRGCPGRGARAKLRRWSDALLSAGGTSRSGHGDTASRDRSSRLDPALALGVIDALQVLEAVTPVEPPASPAGPAKPALPPASLWTATPGELDPLAVLASLEDRPGIPPPRRDSPGLEPEHRHDPEALVDRLAGITP